MIKTNKILSLIFMSLVVTPQIVFGETTAQISEEVAYVHQNPYEASGVFEKALKNQTMNILSVSLKEDGYWAKVQTTTSDGYIKGKDLIFNSSEGIIKEEKTKGYSYPHTEKSTIVRSISKGEKVRIYYMVGDFYKANIDGTTAFILKDTVATQYDGVILEQSLETVRDLSTGLCNDLQAVKIEKMIETAKCYLGNPYVYGGNSLTNGIDCSGFAQQILQGVGVSLPRTSREQSTVGEKVNLSSLKKGDLLFFGTSANQITHVAIYIGGNQMIHAATSKTGICISSLSGGGNPLQTARRVL